MFNQIWQKPTRYQLYTPAILWAIGIFILSAQPSLPGVTAFVFDYFIKKSAHITEYAIFYILVHEAIKYDIKNPIKTSIIAFGLCIAYAMTDEYHQSFVQGRTGTIRDVLYDTIGMFFAWLVKYKYI